MCLYLLQYAFFFCAHQEAKDDVEMPEEVLDGYLPMDRNITCDLPNSLADSAYNAELGYWGGNSFCLADTGQCEAVSISNSVSCGCQATNGGERGIMIHLSYRKSA